MGGAVSFIQNVAMVPLSPVIGMMSSFDAAQVTFHCLFADDVPKHNGAYFSQSSILYADKEAKAGGLPMKSPNPNAEDDELGEKLYAASLKMAGIE